MDQDHFRLTDDTMRHLRTLAQAPGELNWRIELLAYIGNKNTETLLAIQNLVSEVRSIKKSQSAPGELSRVIKAEVESQVKVAVGPEKKDVARLWKAGMWVLEKAVVAALGAGGVLLGLKGMHG